MLYYGAGDAVIVTVYILALWRGSVAMSEMGNPCGPRRRDLPFESFHS